MAIGTLVHIHVGKTFMGDPIFTQEDRHATFLDIALSGRVEEGSLTNFVRTKWKGSVDVVETSEGPNPWVIIQYPNGETSTVYAKVVPVPIGQCVRRCEPYISYIGSDGVVRFQSCKFLPPQGEYYGKFTSLTTHEFKSEQVTEYRNTQYPKVSEYRLFLDVAVINNEE